MNTGAQEGKAVPALLKYDIMGGDIIYVVTSSIFHIKQPSHDDGKPLSVMNSTWPLGIWFSRFFVSSNPQSRKSGKELQLLEYCINWDIYIYSGSADVAAYKWKVHYGRIEIMSFVIVLFSLSISRYRSRYKSDSCISCGVVYNKCNGMDSTISCQTWNYLVKIHSSI